MDWKFASGEVHQELEAVCQKNVWLMRGGIDFEDDFHLESDYPYSIAQAETIAELRRFFEHGNWSIRQGIVLDDLAFINQVNGGDEWWTLKKFDGVWLPFESITFRQIIIRGEFSKYIRQLLHATREQCQNLTYAENPPPRQPSKRKISFIETEAVNYHRNQSSAFAAFIGKSLVQFRDQDWGVLPKEDWEVNQQSPNLQLGVYLLPENVHIKGERTICIKFDGLHTTVYFPGED